MNTRSRFALYFGNRGFFPERLIAAARSETEQALKRLGHDSITMDATATRFGAVETADEGRAYARFLEEHRGKFDGVIIVLPNFGDERGAVEAVRDARVPILVIAYPDEIAHMDFQSRRDAFCGKFSVMDMFYQYRIPYTSFMPHTVHPLSDEFAREIRIFDGVCRVVNGMRRMTVGAIGARTTAFKTVRWDESAMETYGISTEALDLSDIFLRMKSADTGSKRFEERRTHLLSYANMSAVPPHAIEQFTRLSLVLDDVKKEYHLDAMAIRCWMEMQKELGIAPCVLIGEMNDRGIPTACEVDIGNAVAMHALTLASTTPASCLDWNNNYGDDEGRCILFHCGPVPRELMTDKGTVVDHPMFAKALGAGKGYGPNIGRIRETPFTFLSTKTENGKLLYYLGEGEFTGDVIPKEFFGCGGVAKIPDLQRVLFTIGRKGYRHHVSVTAGTVCASVEEAFSNYLKYDRTTLDGR
ncbi:MAG: hypothetical protein AABZ39_01220 [Spirochaetota bacterium]